MERPLDIDSLGSVPAASLENFVYIVGSARGGTTIFKNAFSVHEQLLTLPGMTHFMNQVWRYRDVVHQRLLSQIFALDRCYRPWETAKTMEPARAEAFLGTLRKRLRSMDLATMWGNYALAWGLDPHFPKDPRAVTAWMDKANDASGLSTIAKAFPKGRFLFLFRDPRGSVLSLSRRLASDGGGKAEPISTAEIVRSCIYWRNISQRMLRFAARHPERCLSVRFEDFAHHPEQTMNKAFAFLGLDEIPEQELARRLGEMHYGASNSSETGKGISTKPLERWKTGLSEEQKQLVAELTGVTARKAGYDLQAPGGPVRRLWRALGADGAQGKALALAKTAWLELLEPRT